jgi:hypothetical protein
LLECGAAFDRDVDVSDGKGLALHGEEDSTQAIYLCDFRRCR